MGPASRLQSRHNAPRKPGDGPRKADRARALFGDSAEGRWEQTRGEFHENMRGRVDAGRIAHGRAHAASSVSSYSRNYLLDF